MKSLIHILAIIFLLSACGGKRVSGKLDQIDTLIVNKQYDSANALLENLTVSNMDSEDQAHYYLLSTQLGYLTNCPLQSDSLLDIALSYYKKNGNNKKLSDAYYFKSYRYEINGDYPHAIKYCKNAERYAIDAKDIRLQYKIAESLAFLNGLSGNDLLQLKYSKKSLAIAQIEQNKEWMAYSFQNISVAFFYLGMHDSAYYYLERSIPYIEYVHDIDKAGYYTNIGLVYKSNQKDKAKEFFEKALTYGQLPETIEHLADIYFSEGKGEKAYALWTKAMKMNSKYEKDNLLYSIISYNIEHGNLDNLCKDVDEIINIKDSMLYQLRNDTIKDMQLRFDHEVAMHEADKKLITTQWLVMGLSLSLILMAFYMYFRKRREEMIQKELQMQLYAYTTEIKQLKEAKENSIAQIKDFESDKDKYSRKIIELEENVKNADVAIKELNKSIKKLLDNEAPKLKLGRELYDSIMSGGTAVEWHSKEENLFNNYYSCVNYSSYIKIKRVNRKSNLSPHNMFYLILKDMGKSDDEIRRIMALSPEGLRSLRNRTKPI